ncbi:translocation protein S66 [Saitozyma podzolica]|uniref:Translocation protein S66 n=1 Tax=Saitozyma podzolica TaxID=1890683 RepID=A0A427YU84_9TREE|nr:translocation protein S66 [Saitozyma podzolica]
MATSLIVPLAYITVLVTSLAIFSRVYRRRRAVAKTSFEPWFPAHPTRDVYITLLSSPTPVPDSLLKSALLVRATADVRRIWRLRDDKAALTSLHQRGLIGDDTMERFAAAEKELEAEIVDVVQEAHSFRQGWGGMIFATATEMAQAEKTRETVMSIPKIKAMEGECACGFLGMDEVPDPDPLFTDPVRVQVPSTRCSSAFPSLGGLVSVLSTLTALRLAFSFQQDFEQCHSVHAQSAAEPPLPPLTHDPWTHKRQALRARYLPDTPAPSAATVLPIAPSPPMSSTPSRQPSAPGSGSDEASTPAATGVSSAIPLSGTTSATSTPSKNTPGKKKKGKK